MKNVIKPLAKGVSIPLRLTAAASAADAGIYKKKVLGSGHRPSDSDLHKKKNTNNIKWWNERHY